MAGDLTIGSCGKVGPVVDEYVIGCRRAVESLAAAADDLEARVPGEALLAGVAGRGFFRPAEEAELFAWFACFLTIRNGLWEVLGEVSRPVGGSVSQVLDTTSW